MGGREESTGRVRLSMPLSDGIMILSSAKVQPLGVDPHKSSNKEGRRRGAQAC